MPQVLRRRAAEPVRTLPLPIPRSRIPISLSAIQNLRKALRLPHRGGEDDGTLLLEDVEDGCGDGVKVAFLLHDVRELAGIEIARRGLDGREVKRADGDDPLLHGDEPAVPDRVRDVVARGDRLEDRAEGEFVRAVWRRRDAEKPAFGVLLEVPVDAGAVARTRGVVRLVHDQHREVLGVELHHAPLSVAPAHVGLHRGNDHGRQASHHADDPVVAHLDLAIDPRDLGHLVGGLVDELLAMGEDHGVRCASARTREEHPADDLGEDDGLPAAGRQNAQRGAAGLPGVEHALDRGILVITKFHGINSFHLSYDMDWIVRATMQGVAR